MRQDDVLVIVLAGGVGERLFPLTKERAKPAVYFGGPYRIIDFVLSNCLNSGFRRIFIATQYKSLSLNRHIRQGWSIVSEELGEFIEIIPPQKRVGEHWYQGTADAVYQNLYSIERENPRYVVVLAGDHIYKMDYRKMLQFHIDKGADVTLASIEVPIEQGRRFGIVAVDDEQRVVGFQEKPALPASIPGVSASWRWRRWAFMSSTWICWCERSKTMPPNRTAITTSARTSSRRCSVEVACSRTSSTTRTRSRPSIGVISERSTPTSKPTWTCVKSTRSSISMIRNGRYERISRSAPPAKFVFAEDGRKGEALDSLISPGCIVSGSRILGSILCPNVRVHSFCNIERSILMPGVRVGRHARIRRTIVDRDVLIPRGALIGYDDEEDRRRHTVSDDGVVVVTVDDEPFIGPIPAEALSLEAEADRRG